MTIRLEGDVLFDTGKAQPRPEAQSALEKVAIVLAQFPDSNVEIAGHTDSKGGPAMNLGLSKKRAAAVSEFLKKRAELAKINFTTQGFGETRPIASNVKAASKTAASRSLSKSRSDWYRPVHMCRSRFRWSENSRSGKR